MFRFIPRFTGKFLILATTTIVTIACSNDKKVAISTAKAFLQAYYVDLDFETALRLSSVASHNAITEQEQLTVLNPYAKEERPDISFKNLEMDPNNTHVANYVYTCNRVERKLPLRKLNDKWLVDLQGGTVEMGGVENEFLELSYDRNNGFASAVSGKIEYRKRRQGRHIDQN